MKWIILITIAFTLLLMACTASKTVSRAEDKVVKDTYDVLKYSGPKKKMAIAKFENATRFGKRRLGENMTTVLTTELAKTQRYILLERAEIGEVLDQIALSQSGITEGTLEQIQLLDADFVMTGAVTHYAVNTTGSSNLFTQSKTQTAEVGVDVRIIDVRSGEILLSVSGRGKVEKEFDKVLGMGVDGGYDESLEMDAFRMAVIDVVENIVTTIDNSPWTCDVVKIDGIKLYIDAGKKSDLNQGMVLDILKRGQAISNLTGQLIGYEETRIGTGTITDFFGVDGSVVIAESDSLFTLPLFCRLHEEISVQPEK